MAQGPPPYPPAPSPQLPPPAGQPAVPPGWVVRPPTNWKMVSGWVLFLGIALIGIGFLLYAIAIAQNSFGAYIAEDFLGLLGVGIIVIGLSFALARMG